MRPADYVPPWVRAFVGAVVLGVAAAAAIELGRRLHEAFADDAELAARRAIARALHHKHIDETVERERNQLAYEAWCIANGREP